MSGPSRVARIPYLNSVPYYVNWDDLAPHSEGRWASHALPPRQLGMAMAEGQADAGLLPVADLIRLQADVTPLSAPEGSGASRLGIACRGRVDSVLLFVRDAEGGVPLTGRRPSLVLGAEDLEFLSGAHIALTEESSTSVRLLRLLLEVRHGIRPAAYERQGLRPVEDRFRAALVIGDQALRWRVRPPDGFVQAMDLASEWCDWTGLPFVFACWSVRRDLDPGRAQWLSEFLVSSLADADPRLAELASGLPAELGTAASLTEYLRNFIYRLGPEEIDSMNRFQALLSEHGIPCTED
ncbi:MAG: MqnA/MqnD/SBP family protein [Candidatus Eisenbacteria bacterium]|uniref:Chorismate dehydratase n=1 Tax=Eiseniibacteriota bacterium TaxID=2212470 RepID=A0A956LZY7_UNCEI|nr:hypothetical protein [Candidatus Eisenbacteria bacterium]